MINSYKAGSNNTIRGIKNTYHIGGNKKIKITNNTKAINIVSSLSKPDIDRDSISSVNFGNNVLELDDNCLSGCRNLQYVGGTKINKVGDRTFCDCTSLTSIEFFNKGTKTNLSEIGERAFSNTGLVNVYIKPDQNANTKIEPYAFADCQNLKYVETIQFNTFGDYQFQNCTALETVKMANSHGYMGKYVFQNCSRLKNITIPAVTWGIGEGMFCDCTSLTSIEFNEPSELNMVNCFNNFFLSGTAIESITFPKSVTKIECFDNWALNGMDNLKEIHFNGISFDKLVNQDESSIPVSLPPYIWSIASDTKQQFITANFEKSDMRGKDFESFAKINNVAIFEFFTTTSSATKPKEKNQEIGNYFSMDTFKVWMNNLKKPITFLERNAGSGTPYFTFSYYSTSDNVYKTGLKINCEYQFNDLTQVQREQTLKTIISEKIEPNIKEYLDQEGEVPQVDFKSYYPANTLISNSQKYLNGSPLLTCYYDITNKLNYDIFGNIFTYANERHMPIFGLLTGQNCSICTNVFRQAINTKEFKDYLQELSDQGKQILFIESQNNSPIANEIMSIHSRCGKTDTSYVWFVMRYVDNDGKVYENATNFHSDVTPNMLISTMRSWIPSNYIGPSSKENFQMNIINGTLVSTNCFGLNHNVQIFSNDGKSINFKCTGEILPPEFVYEPIQVVDTRTVDNFKYGQWYGNTKELKDFVDKNHIPVMVEIGSDGCPPCKTFNATVYQDSEFQNYVQNNVPIILGKVEGTGGNTNSQFTFAYESWCNQSDSDFPVGKMPLMLFYWNRGSGNIKKKYVPYQKGENDYLSIDEIEAEIQNFIQGYQRVSEFNKPQIDKTELSGYPRYIKYVTNEQDVYGRYVPVKNLEYVGETTLSVKNSSGVLTEYTINQGQKEGIPPVGTYQYFTLPFETENYEIEYQREGVLFRVGTGGQEKYNELNKFSYNSKQISDYEQDNNLKDPFISENFSIYEEGTTKINSGLEKDQIYNLVYTYNLSQPIKRGETNYHKVKIYLSAEVSCNPDLTYDIIGERYVLTADWYYYIDNDVQVQWLSAFDNYKR